MIPKDETIATWKSRGGKYWLTLYQTDSGFKYQGDGCGGNIGNVSLGEAMAHMENLVDVAYDGISLKRS